MKLIDIQQKFFQVRGESGIYFCTEAETDSCLNVKAVHFIRINQKHELPSDWYAMKTRSLRGDQIREIVVEGGLGMPYSPISKHVKILNTQTPDSMGNEIHAALEKLKKAVGGDVTKFVCERLQWSLEEVDEYLLAEQVDAVALAIYNFEARNQAMIIGDQTGIGKGRIASSIIRYAVVQGYVPVYCTENAGLFSDNYRDLRDIGCEKLVPFIINSSTSGATDARITVKDKEDNDVVVHTPITNKKEKEAIFSKGKMPEGYDYVLTTYSQLKNAYKTDKKGNQTKGEDFLKYTFLKEIAPNAIFIFDESHNISGSKVVKKNWYDSNSDVELGGSNQFLCFNQLAKEAANVLFLSATFAKRPENLVVYANRTSIKEAGLKDSELIEAISNGGEALQEIISSNIVEEGQMIRRESIYKGIKINYITLNKECAKEYGTPDLEKQHTSMCDYVTKIINLINVFEQTFVEPIIDSFNKSSTDKYEKTSKNTGASHTPLFSKLFQIVNQLLFAIKAEAVADHAVRRLNEGKKVVIGISSTMEAFIKQLDDTSDEISCDFTLVLEKALKNTLVYTIDGEDGYHNKTSIPLSELPEGGEAAYYEILDAIHKASSGISISPIDIITQKIEAAVNPETGEHWKVTEVTGRSQKILFSNKECTRGRIVPRKPVKRSIAFQDFQCNRSDVLIINSSGATGASAHATTKDTNLREDQVKPRVMIIAQTELDINKEVQKRGRINRTGQLKNLPPSYDYISSAIPAENRLMMMLQKKLRSLDANSTSNQKQSTSIIDVPDFFNKYGDKIAFDYLIDNPSINEKLNEPAMIEKDGSSEKVATDFLKKVSGYVPLLTCEEQSDFYNTILENYQKHVENLKAKGEYDLEVESMDLNAELIGNLKPLIAGTTGNSKFADAAYQGTYRCKVLRKPLTQAEVQAIVSNYCNGEDAKELAQKKAQEYEQYYDGQLAEEFANLDKRCENDIEARFEKVKNNGGTKEDMISEKAIIEDVYREKKERVTARINAQRSRSRFIKFFHAGRACIVDGDTNTKGICLGVEYNEKAKNKYAPSSITVSFACASSVKMIDCVLSDKDKKTLEAIMGMTSSLTSGYYDRTDYDKKYIDEWNSYCKSATADYEQRVIITGNILRGYKSAPEHSKLISFTMSDGSIQKGILAPQKNTLENGSPVLILSKYPINKMRGIIEKIIKEKQRCVLKLTRGVTLEFGRQYEYNGRVLCGTIRVLDKKTAKHFAQMDEWTDLFERGFYYSNYGGGYNEFSTDQIDEILDILEKYDFQVELTPQESENYFGAEKVENKIKWKSLKTDESKIPASRPQKPSDDQERKRMALLNLAKAKIAIAKAKSLNGIN